MKSRVLQLGTWSLFCFLIGAWSTEADAAAVAKQPAVVKKTVVRKTAVKRKAPARTYSKSNTKAKTRKAYVTRPLTALEIENQQQVVQSVNAISKPEQMAHLWATAQTFLNTPYKLGSNTLLGTDCSGYTSSVYRDLGVPLPRTANQQFLIGTAVDLKELALGDLVFYGPSNRYASHVGLYIGNGNFMHASSGSRRVRIDRLTPMLGNRRYLGAKRILAEPALPAFDDTTTPIVAEEAETNGEQAQQPQRN